MATYNQVTVTNLNIIETYKSLMEASTGQGSAYLKAKETLTDSLGSMNGLAENEKAKLIADTIVSITKSVTSDAMQMALQIDKENRDAPYALTKLREDTLIVSTNIEKMNADIAMIEASTAKIVVDTTMVNTNILKAEAEIAHTEETTKQVVVDNKIKTSQGWKIQAELYRDFGVLPTGLSTTKDLLISSDYDEDYGTKYEAIRLAKASVYNTYAESSRRSGVIKYTTNTVGDLLTAVPQTGLTINGSTEDIALTYWQTMVAKRQEKGYDDNMRQHVANSSASMISMLLSTEASGIDYDPIMGQWANSIGYLNGSEWIDTNGVPNDGDWKTLVEIKY